MNDNGPKRRFLNSIPVQTLIALSFNNVSLLAGGLISIYTPHFNKASWILALFPPILTIRGGIGGVFSGNLATMLHLGLIKPRIRGNTKEYSHLVSASLVMTVIDTLAMGLFAFLFNLALGRTSIDHFFLFIMVPPITCVMALALSIPLTSVIAIITFVRGLDPDILIYPILASINDIVVTTAFVATIFVVLSGGWFLYLFAGFFVAILVLAGFLTYRNRKEKFFNQTIKEGIIVVILSSVFGSINGSYLASIGTILQRQPGIVVLYPALTNALGNIGSIVGSTKTTELALGYVKSLTEELRSAVSIIVKVEVVTFVMHIVFAVVTYTIVISRNLGVSLLLLVGIALMTNILSFLFVSFFAVATAHIAFMRGLNPDNIVIPLITSISDTVATLATIYSLFILNTIGVI